MPRTATRARTFAPPPGGTLDTQETSLLTLLASIERHDPAAPAAAAFRSALRRKGIEAGAAGGRAALDVLMHDVADADPERAEARAVIIRRTWADLLPQT